MMDEQLIPQDGYAGESGESGEYPPEMHEPQPEQPAQEQGHDWDLLASLPDWEVQQISTQVDRDLMDATTDHSRRTALYMMIYAQFRKLVDPGDAPGEEDDSNIRVPLIQWSTFQQAAAEYNAMFGQGARVIAEPSNEETATDSARLVGAFISARLITQMQFPRKVMEFLIYRALFGRAYAYRPWVRTIDSFIDDEGKEQEECYYEGADFITLWPGDVMRPAKDHVRSIHDFYWVAVRRRYSVSDLIRAEQRGEFHGIVENLNDLYNAAGRGAADDWTPDELLQIKREASGADPVERSDPRGDVIVYEYYGRRNLPADFDGTPVSEQDWDKRELLPTEIVVHRIPSIGKVVGIQDLKRLDPRQRRRRPIWESALPYGDGYERQGLGELLSDVEEDLTANERQFTDTVRRASMGMGFHDSSVGFPAKEFTLKPGFMHPVQNANGIKMVSLAPDFQSFMLKAQSLQAIVEKVTGQSDFSMGRTPDRPNTPRTLGGQSLMVQMGNVRVAVSMDHFNQDLSELMEDIWAMECNMGDPTTAFRILETDQLEGQFDLSGDRSAKLTAKERNGRYTFRFKFAPDEISKQLEEQKATEIFTLMMQNPLIATNPVALWEMTNNFMKAKGAHWFASKVPKPADPGIPKDPNAEWAMMLDGQDVSPSPQEDFKAHAIKHQMQYQAEMRQPRPDADAIHRLETHIIETQDMQAAVIQQQQQMAQLQAHLAVMGSQAGKQPGQSAKPEQGGGVPNGQPQLPGI